MRKNKLNNRKTTIDKIVFGSKKEASAYPILKLMEKSGKIRDLQLQVPFTLMEGYRGVDGKKVRDMTYVADFTFFDNEKNKKRVLDVKGFKTEVFKIKEKLFNKKMLDNGIKIEYEI